MNKILYLFIISINLFASSDIIKDKYGFEYKTITSSITGKFWLVHISEYSDSNVGVQPDTFAMRFSSL